MRACAIFAFVLALAGCATTPSQPPDTILRDALFDPPSQPIRAADVFAVSPEMKAFLVSDIERLVRIEGTRQGLFDALHDKARVFAFFLVVFLVLVPALLLYLRGRGTGVAPLLVAGAALLVCLVAIGYPVQRHYLENRFANDGSADERIPGMHLDSAYRWARGVEGSRIGLAGTSAGFAGYGFYGTDLSNRVRYLGEEGPHGAFNAIPTCAAFRAAVNEAELDYLVTAPFLNFLHPGEPVTSPEARWLRGEKAVQPVLRSGRVTVWRVKGDLDPDACAAANAPLREIPQTPTS